MRTYLAYLSESLPEPYNGFWEMVVSRTSLSVTQGKRGTVGHSVTHYFRTEEACLEAAERYIKSQKDQHYIFVGGSRLHTHKLPVLLQEGPAETLWLTDEILYYAPADVRHITITIDHQLSPHTDYPDNLYARDKGVFCSTAYEVAARGVEKMIWLPELSSYGIWHQADRQLFLFAGHTWESVRHDIRRYFSQYRSFPNILSHVNVWEWFDFIPAGLADEAAQILSITDDELRVTEAEAFIRLYEERLLQHPFSMALEDAFRALVMLYNYRGQWFEERAEYGRAVEWLERAAFIIHQSEAYRTRLFIHTFLQLSFCSMELSTFGQARLYIDTYALYDPSAQEECEQIRSSISNIQNLYHSAMDAYTRTLSGGTPQQYEHAILITLQALQYAPNDAVLHFNLACFYSVLRDLSKSLYYLDLAFQKGFQNAAKLFNDHDLENIRTTKEFTDMFIHYFRPDANEN